MPQDSPYLPQQPNNTECRLYLIAFAQEYVNGGDPESPHYHLTSQDVQHLHACIGMRLACEWQSQNLTGSKPSPVVP